MRYGIIRAIAAAGFIACIPAHAEEKTGSAQAFINEISKEACANPANDTSVHCLQMFHTLDQFAARHEAVAMEFEALKQEYMNDTADKATKAKKYGPKIDAVTEKGSLAKITVETGVRGLALAYGYKPLVEPLLEKLK